MIGERLEFPPVWLADLGADHPFLHLTRPGDRHGTTFALGVDQVLLNEAMAHALAEVGTLDVLAIGVSSVNAVALLKPVRDRLGVVRRLVDVEPWPFAWAKDSGTFGRSSGFRKSLRAAWSQWRSAEGAVQEISSALATRGEHRCCAIASSVYKLGRGVVPVDFAVLTMLERNFCVDRVSVTPGGAAASVETLIELPLENGEQAPKDWPQSLVAQLLEKPTVKKVLPSKLYYEAYFPEDVNLKLEFQWPGNFGGCNFGVLQGLYVMWLRHNGQWLPA